MILACLLAAAAQDAAAEPSRVPLLDHRQLQVAMARLATEHPDLVTVLPVGTLPSRGGRRIEALRLSAGDRKPGRPAILLVANVDGPLAWTSGVALHHAQALAEGYAGDARIQALLDSTTLYIVPRANPDAAEARFQRPLLEARATGQGVDNDRDGRAGEDGPSDVDEDGIVAWMRVPDPDGEWMPDPHDARATIRADRKKGQRGIWKLVAEGRDADKDESASEDPELDAVVNRNFPQGWKAHAADSGAFATDEPEARDLCQFLLDHRDVALVVTYGAQDNLVEKPKTAKEKEDGPRSRGLPPEGTLESDADLLAELGRRYKKITKSAAKGDADDHGSFQAWCRDQRGLWTVNLALWTIPLDEPEGEKPSPEQDKNKQNEKEKEKDKDRDKDEDKPSDDAKRLRWMDAQNEIARFVAWRKVKHPELGDVEIGGFAPFATIEPPEAERNGIAERELEFLVSLGDVLPRVKISECTAKDLFGGLWEVKAAIEDAALLPLQSAAARRAGSVRPARVSIALPPGARLLAGNREQLVRDLPGSGGRKELRWLVHGAPPTSLSVDVDTDHAGAARAVPEVK